MMQRRDVLKAIGAVTLPFAIGRAGPVEASVEGAVDYGWNPAISAPTEADLYVAPGGDDSAAGTIDRPLRTIQAGIDHGGVPGIVSSVDVGAQPEKVRGNQRFAEKNGGRAIGQSRIDSRPGFDQC